MNDSVTAPNLEALIAGVLAGHQVSRPSNCACGWKLTFGPSKPLKTHDDAHADHQAKAVAAALTEAGSVEWGVRYENADGTTGVIDHLTEAQARDHYLVTRRTKGPLAKVVSRLTGPWTAVAG